MPERYHYSPEQRQLLRDEVFAKLELGVASIQDSASFQKYLSLQAKFHNYSWANVALILAQRPDATQVASFRKWKALDRSVKKGEKGIRILAPTFGTDEDTGEAVLRGFIPVAVFDVSQTEGAPLPEPALPLRLEGEDGPALFDALLDYAQGERVHVRLARHRLELDPDTNGDYNPRSREIRLRANPMQQMTKTLAHELAHHVHLQYLGAQSEQRTERETVAEGAAYVVTQYFGLETGEYSFPYIAGWAGNRERLVHQLEVIHRVSAHMIDALVGADTEELKSPGWSPRPLHQPARSSPNTSEATLLGVQPLHHFETGV